MPNSQVLDRTFHALASDVRRQVVARLAGGPASVGDLADPFDMALPSFLGHIRVLEQAGCLTSEKVGRVRTCHLTPAPVDLAGSWITEQRTLWTARTDRLERFLLDEDQR